MLAVIHNTSVKGGARRYVDTSHSSGVPLGMKVSLAHVLILVCLAVLGGVYPHSRLLSVYFFV